MAIHPRDGLFLTIGDIQWKEKENVEVSMVQEMVKGETPNLFVDRDVEGINENRPKCL